MGNKTGFYFTTDSGNKYFYNDNDGNVTLTNNSDDIDFLFDENSEVDSSFEANADEISTYLKYNGYNQLILVVTEKCNLRCKYCIYSGNYDNQREHGMNVMSFDTAKKAIDRFYDTQKERIRENVLHMPLIGFYGGEPLMNFNLIKECVAYARKLFEGNITFLVTTNGTIMTDEIADFLIENEFALSVSLNGDKKENDRLRVFENGLGTFEAIMKNMDILRGRSREYYEKHVAFIGCFDWKSDLDSINRFCLNNDYNIPPLSRISGVNDCFTDWYNQYSADEKKAFFDKKREIGKNMAEKLADGIAPDPIERLLYAGSVTEVLNRPLNISAEAYKPSFVPYSGTCIPGTKLCVLPNGTIHSCEKINNSRSIGNVDDGVNFKAIAEMLTDYYKAMAPVCVKCPVKRMCSLCFTACLDDKGNFTRSQVGNCQKVREAVREKFTYVFNLLEKGITEEELLNLSKKKTIAEKEEKRAV